RWKRFSCGNVVDVGALMCSLSGRLRGYPAERSNELPARATTDSLSCAQGQECEATEQGAPWRETTRRGQPDGQREDAECAGRLPQSHSPEQDSGDHLPDQRGQDAGGGQLIRQLLPAPAPRRTRAPGVQARGVDGDAGGGRAPV